MSDQPIAETSLPDNTQHSQEVDTLGLLWMSDQPTAETSLPDNTQHSQEVDVHVPGGI